MDRSFYHHLSIIGVEKKDQDVASCDLQHQDQMEHDINTAFKHLVFVCSSLVALFQDHTQLIVFPSTMMSLDITERHKSFQEPNHDMQVVVLSV